jgi:NADH/NAD ratio-sensing transcriptional regulator Rex
MTDAELVELLAEQSMEDLKVFLDRVGVKVGTLKTPKLRAQEVVEAVRKGKYANGNIAVGEFASTELGKLVWRLRRHEPWTEVGR